MNDLAVQPWNFWCKKYKSLSSFWWPVLHLVGKGSSKDRTSRSSTKHKNLEINFQFKSFQLLHLSNYTYPKHEHDASRTRRRTFRKNTEHERKRTRVRNFKIYEESVRILSQFFEKRLSGVWTRSVNARQSYPDYDPLARRALHGTVHIIENFWLLNE